VASVSVLSDDTDFFSVEARELHSFAEALGCHVKHEEGKTSAKRRAEHLAKTRKQREKENFGKK
jgi:hypothetical protein